MRIVDLSLGELVHDESFGLFEAMSAIEMMDPKMDAGMMTSGGSCRRPPLTYATAQAGGHLDTSGNSDLIGVYDQTLACLVTWLEGHSLAQTVFTNLYLHAPFQATQPFIKAFSVVTLKLVDLIKDFVAKG